MRTRFHFHFVDGIEELRRKHLSSHSLGSHVVLSIEQRNANNISIFVNEVERITPMLSGSIYKKYHNTESDPRALKTHGRKFSAVVTPWIIFTRDKAVASLVKALRE